jgi:ankyrin repeat protein
MAQKLGESRIAKCFHKAREAFRKLKPDKSRRIISKKEQHRLNMDFVQAAREGNDEAIKRLLKLGADINAKNDVNTPALMWTAYNGDTKICAFLISNGADVNVGDGRNRTALMHAATSGQTETCAFLLEKGANINARDKDGQTALGKAEMWDRKETVKFLKLYTIRNILGKKEADRFLSVFNKCIQ